MHLQVVNPRARVGGVLTALDGWACKPVVAQDGACTLGRDGVQPVSLEQGVHSAPVPLLRQPGGGTKGTRQLTGLDSTVGHYAAQTHRPCINPSSKGTSKPGRSMAYPSCSTSQGPDLVAAPATAATPTSPPHGHTDPPPSESAP
jgi:hypothetical protein